MMILQIQNAYYVLQGIIVMMVQQKNHVLLGFIMMNMTRGANHSNKLAKYAKKDITAQAQSMETGEHHHAQLEDGVLYSTEQM